MTPNSDLCPEHTKDGLNRWAMHGISPGGFGRAVLENDLMAAFRRADDVNLANMAHIVAYVYNRLPAACAGSKEAVAAWPERLAEYKAQIEAEYKAAAEEGSTA